MNTGKTKAGFYWQGWLFWSAVAFWAGSWIWGNPDPGKVISVLTLGGVVLLLNRTHRQSERLAKIEERLGQR